MNTITGLREFVGLVPIHRHDSTGEEALLPAHENWVPRSMAEEIS